MVHEAVLKDNVLSVSVPRETAFYMAGAKFVEETDDGVVIKLIRCKLKKTCDVDFKATYNHDLGHHEMNVPSKSITLDFGDKTTMSVPKSD